MFFKLLKVVFHTYDIKCWKYLIYEIINLTSIKVLITYITVCWYENLSLSLSLFYALLLQSDITFCFLRLFLPFCSTGRIVHWNNTSVHVFHYDIYPHYLRSSSSEPGDVHIISRSSLHVFVPSEKSSMSAISSNKYQFIT